MEYSSSRRILQDVHKYCPNIKVDFAYSLARGGVAIHTACQSDCDLLAKELPAEAFGGGVKHPPKGKGRRCNTVYIKGVNTSVEIPSLGGFLQKEGVSILEIRRLTKRYTGRPTQVIKVICEQQSAHKLLSIRLIVNNKRCIIESERRVKVIRCYHCQTLGHVAKNCTNARRCEICAQNHDERQRCMWSVNCMGNHPSSSSICPAFRNRYEDITKQHTECKRFSANASANITETRY